MMMKHSIHILAAAAALAATANAGAGENLLRVSAINVARVDTNLVLSLDINPRTVNPGRDKEVIFTPFVYADSDTVCMPAVRIAGRNRYYSHIRNNDLAKGEKVYDASSAEVIKYRAEVPFRSWMERSQIDVRQTLGNCCKPLRDLENTPVARLDYVVPEMPVSYSFVELTGDSAIVLTAEGRAYVDFVVNETIIKEKYRKNRIELPKILETIDKVKRDPDATITRITIKGFASPEGSYSNNVRLAMGRTEALKEFVRNRLHFDPEIMHTDYEPEDWEGLRAWVEQCTLPHREEILQIIDSKMEPDPKNAEIERRFPEEYKLMKDSVYPGLRHSDYTVKYRIRAYATVDELLEVFKKTPERMRPVDFQRIAALFPPESDNYEEIMLKAVEIHPNDPDANLNAATIMLRKGDIEAADYYLAHAGNSAEAAFTRGMAAAMQKDYSRSQVLLQQSADLGLAKATEELETLDALLHKPQVEYLIEPEE